MRTKRLKSGFELPVIGFGTWMMGGALSVDKKNDKSDIEAIKFAIKSGLTHIDTAEMYAAGHAEELIGQAIIELEKEYPKFNRKDLFITSKVMPSNLEYENVIKSCKNSLKRLGLKYLDLYLIHIPNSKIPIEETMKALNDLKDLGLIDNIGVSNFSVEELKEAQKHSEAKIRVNQIEYSIFAKEKGMHTDKMHSEIIPYCQKNDILVEAWRPLGKGKFWELEDETITALTRKYECTKAQLFLAWVISKKNVVTLFKSSTPAHIEENIKAANIELEKADIIRLSKLDLEMYE